MNVRAEIHRENLLPQFKYRWHVLRINHTMFDHFYISDWKSFVLFGLWFCFWWFWFRLFSTSFFCQEREKTQIKSVRNSVDGVEISMNMHRSIDRTYYASIRGNADSRAINKWVVVPKFIFPIVHSSFLKDRWRSRSYRMYCRWYSLLVAKHNDD